MAYAQVNLEDRDEDGTVTRYAPGDEVPESLNGYDELVEHGAVVEEFDPEADVLTSPQPDYVEIDGVRYLKVDDTSTVEGSTDA